SRGEAIGTQRAILHGEPIIIGGTPAPLDMWRNRILFPALLEGTGRMVPLSENIRYLLLRWATASLAVFVFWHTLVSAGAAGRRAAAMGVALLCTGLLITFLSFGLEIPSDFPDVAFTAAFLLATLKHRRGWLLAMAILGAANRESAAYAGIIWAAVHGLEGRLRWKEIGFGFVVSVLSYAVTLGLRQGYGIDMGSNQQLLAVSRILLSVEFFLASPGLTSWPILALWMFGVPLVLIVRGWRQLEPVDHRILIATAATTLITVLFGLIHELRVFLPDVTLLAYVAARTMRNPPCVE
ncbi:MAG TPA: hypothetical protein VK968_11480, partial [Roseimicrobium sp.]|nr:hypothetical protein [Roseimicrobium sp.]